MRAPAATLVELRTMTPVTGRPPIAPETMLAVPWPIISRSKLVRGPLCMRSTDTADSRLSTLAMSAMVKMPPANAAQLPSGRLGNASASISDSLISIRLTSNGASTDRAVTPTIATSGAGTLLTGAGTQRHPTRVMITSRPSSTAGQCALISWAGSSEMLAQAELLELPPSSTCTCCSAMVTPMPASIACTTTGEMASAARATRLSPNSTCKTPAPTVMAQVTAQPNWEIRPATTTVNPAAGPLTCSGDPPRAPATMPPTIAAMMPASTGAPEATAMPRDRGRATKNTTSDAGRSYRRTDLARSASWLVCCMARLRLESVMRGLASLRPAQSY
ncbi:hypothetical protein BN975_02209 [Mycolicibacterium farcinogenes]|nr:hypothetical protein BN975_02209 [Mycolicibacterium farcinogenes]